MLAVLALDRGARAGRSRGAGRRALRAVAVVGAHDLELELAGDLDPARRGGRLADRGGGGAGVPARPGRSVLAGDVAQELGQLAEGGNLDPLGSAGAAVELVERRAGDQLGGDPAHDLWDAGQWWYRGCYRESLR